MDHRGHREFGDLFNSNCGGGMGLFRRRSHLLFPNHVYAGLACGHLRGQQIQPVETRLSRGHKSVYQLPDLDYQFTFQ